MTKHRTITGFVAVSARCRRNRRRHKVALAFDRPHCRHRQKP